MKTGSLLIVAFFAPALLSYAQDKTPAAPDTAAPATQDTSRPAVPSAPALVVPDSYVIGTSDVVTVTVYKEPTLSSSVLVRPDGMISLPLLGDVKADGKTPLQLADDVTAKLKKYVQDPNVTVTLTAMNSKKVYLIGEIGKTGPIDMTSGMTLLQAIATAGGLTPYANTKKIYILRTVGGKQQKIFVHYKQALKGDESFNLPLNPDDTIVVP